MPWSVPYSTFYFLFSNFVLKQQIQTDIKDAMKQGNQMVVDTLRMAVSSVNAKEKEKRYNLSKDDSEMKEGELLQASQLIDDEIIGVLSSEIKKRKDAIALYQQGNRPELAEKEQQEIAILQTYLPEQLSPEELKKIVQASIQKTGAATIKDMGRIMADLMPQVKGKADNGEISKIVKELLAK